MSVTHWKNIRISSLAQAQEKGLVIQQDPGCRIVLFQATGQSKLQLSTSPFL